MAELKATRISGQRQRAQLSITPASGDRAAFEENQRPDTWLDLAASGPAARIGVGPAFQPLRTSGWKADLETRCLAMSRVLKKLNRALFLIFSTYNMR